VVSETVRAFPFYNHGVKRLLLLALVGQTLVAFLAGAALLLGIPPQIESAFGDLVPLTFAGSLLLSPALALVVANRGPQRPEGLLKLEDPFDQEARSRAKARLLTFLRVFTVGIGMGLAAALTDSLFPAVGVAGLLLLGSSSCLMILLAPWIALYARWFRIVRV
jgi:hypothetical protein